VIEEAKRVVREKKLDVQLSVLQPFYDQPEYRRAGGQRPALSAAGLRSPAAELSWLPERHLTKLDPTGQHCFKNDDCCRNASPASLATCYRAQCLRSAAEFASAWAPDGKWSVSFQSRLGRAKWIEPYTEARLDELAKWREKAAGDVPGVRR
jgi:ferrochelatase